jgi:predicted  nucleic acid-binding Zn-ribbon protein
MTNTQQQPQFTIAELGAKFGAQQAQMLSDLILAEKLIESLRAQIQDMTRNETKLTDHIQDLESDFALLKSEKFELEEELAARPTPEQLADLEAQVDELIADGPTVAHSAARDLAKVSEGNQKAALVEAA